MPADRILLFIPCYNCAPQIGRVLGQVRGEAARFIDEVLVLDNGSRDGTVEAAIEASADVPVPTRVARNRDNYNLGGSHKAAYVYAEANGFSHVVTLHGDDQGNLADLLPVLRSGDHRRFDACMGARFMRGSTLSNYSAVRIIGNRLFNRIFSIAAGQHVTDMGSGLNLLARSAFTDPRLGRLPDDLHFNPYLLLDMIGNGRSVHFFPISWREDDQVSNVKMISQALETLRAPLLYKFARTAFRDRDFRARRRNSYAFDFVV
jgi:glycosyltransferase involved in cell wall biosynthesis